MKNSRLALTEAATKCNSATIPNIEKLMALIPAGAEFFDDTWNVQTWGRIKARPTEHNIYFGRIEHQEIREAIKIILLVRRMERKIGPSSASSYFYVALALSAVLRHRPLKEFTSQDAHLAAKVLLNRSSSYLATLSTVIGAMRHLYGISAYYQPPKTAEKRYGTKGTDQGRKEKRISDFVLKLMMQLLHQDDLPDDDRIFLCAIAFNLGCGWRIGELLTLPKDCLFRDEGALYVRGYPSKKGKISPKLVPPALAPMVEEAHQIIIEITNKGRTIAKSWPLVNAPDWRRVLKNETAILYFSQKLLHHWGSDPDNRLINPDAAWRWHHGWIDILGEIAKHSSERQAYTSMGLDWNTFNDLKKQQLAARQGRLWTRNPNMSLRAWMRDERVCDHGTLFRQMGMASGQNHHTPAIRALIAEALECQKSGDAIPLPSHDEKMESEFRRQRPVLLASANGKPLLYVDDALFVTPRHFVGSFTNKDDEWQNITIYHFMQWLKGTPSRPSVFERYGVIDPETNEIAKFTSHQIRHWLETQLHKGGLTNAQIATLMNRNGTSANSTYNQLSNAERRAMVKEGIYEGKISGVVAGVVKRADVTSEEAEEILASRLRQINVMPHGLCLKDLATEPCPHHMSCFSTATERKRSNACSHLIVDTTDSNQISEIRREYDNAIAMVEMFEEDPDLEDSPQALHFKNIAKSTNIFLKEANKL